MKTTTKPAKSRQQPRVSNSGLTQSRSSIALSQNASNSRLGLKKHGSLSSGPGVTIDLKALKIGKRDTNISAISPISPATNTHLLSPRFMFGKRQSEATPSNLGGVTRDSGFINNTTINVNKPRTMAGKRSETSFRAGVSKPPVTGFGNKPKENDTSMFWSEQKSIVAKNSMLRNTSTNSASQPHRFRRGTFDKEMLHNSARLQTKQKEHVLAGQDMAKVIRPESRIYDTEKPANDVKQVGLRLLSPSEKRIDPISRVEQMCEASKNTKKNASVRKYVYDVKNDRLDMPTDKSAKEIKKTLSRERYFTSHISTLPGPQAGLHAGKMRQDKRQDIVEECVKENKGVHSNRDRIFDSHISVLGGKTSTSHTMDQIDQANKMRDAKRFKADAFLKKQAHAYGSSIKQQGGQKTLVVNLDLTSPTRSSGNQSPMIK